jgi:PAS domain S-box-containing protein
MMTSDHKLSILLVEDDVIIAIAETKMLENLGYCVHPVYSGSAAIEAIRNEPALDLVLMDINLDPGIDGTDAAVQILAHRELPIVFLTSHTERSFVERVRKITRYGYIIKNSGAFVINSSIEMALELFDAHKQLAAAKERLAYALEGSNDGLWDVLLQTGEVYLNHRGCEILGYEDRELPEVAQIWSDLVHPDDMPKTLHALDEHLQGRKGNFSIIQRLRIKSGKYKLVLTRGRIVQRDPDGRPKRMVGTHTDLMVDGVVNSAFNVDAIP